MFLEKLSGHQQQAVFTSLDSEKAAEDIDGNSTAGSTPDYWKPSTRKGPQRFLAK